MERIHLRDIYINVANDPFASDIALPQSYKQAINGRYTHEWRQAIKSEIESLRRHHVFELIHESELPRDANLISAKWVFKVKPNADGSIERFKYRLCARG